VTEEKLFGCRLLRQLGHRIISIFYAWFGCKQEDLSMDSGEFWVILVLEFHGLTLTKLSSFLESLINVLSIPHIQSIWFSARDNFTSALECEYNQVYIGIIDRKDKLRSSTSL